MLEIIFDQQGEFKAFYAAELFCQNNDISCGTLGRDLPIGLMWGDVEIAKWRNLSVEDIKLLHGRMTSKDYRNGPITLRIVEHGRGTYDNA